MIPKKHYTLIRQWLLNEGKLLVESGRYFTLLAPRQAGKTTYFQLLLQQLKSEGYTPLWISFEGFKTLRQERFYVALNHVLNQEFTAHNIDLSFTIEDHFDLRLLLEKSVNSVTANCSSH